MTEITAELADQIVAATVSVPGVVGLDGGFAGEAATYLPGHRVPGVRVNDYDRVEVHIVAAYGSAVAEVAEAVRIAVCRVAPGPVDVCVEDVVDLEGPLAAS